MKLLLALAVSLVSISTFAQVEVAKFCSPEKAKNKIEMEARHIGTTKEGQQKAIWTFTDMSTKTTMIKKVTQVTSVSLPPQALNITTKVFLEVKYGIKLKDVEGIAMTLVKADSFDDMIVAFTIEHNKGRIYQLICPVTMADADQVSEEGFSALFDVIKYPVFEGSEDNCK